MTEQKANSALDLSAFDAAIKRQEQGIEVDILGPDDTPIGLKIKVAGPDSQRAQKAEEELTDELLAEMADDPAGGRKVRRRAKAADAMKRNIRYLARLTMGWEPPVALDGKPPMAYSIENAEELYTRFRFIREQVDAAGGNRARFTKG